MVNKLMDETSKSLKKLKEANLIYSFYRQPNIPPSISGMKKTFGDHLVITMNGFVIFIEAKSGIHHSINNVFEEKQRHQIELNQKLLYSAHSKHIYLFGFYFRNPRISDTFKYFITLDIKRLVEDNKKAINYKDLIENIGTNTMADNNLDNLLLRFYDSNPNF